MAVRVLWVVKGLGPGGAERLLVAAARAHDPRKVQIECAYVLPYKDHLVSALESAGVRCTCLSQRDDDIRWPLTLRALISEGGFDVVHAHSPVPGSVARTIVRTMPANRRPALMSTEHNTWARHRLPTRLLNGATGRWDEVTFAVSEETRASISGPAASRAQVLTHGIDVDEAAAQARGRDEVRSEFGIDPDALVIGTVANFTAQKDYPNLLAAARLLIDSGTAATIVAVGQGPLEAQIHARADELGLGDAVVFTGFRDDAVRVLGACDVFTLASAWEGLPVALMEALALGLPVVATRVGGVAETMTDGEDALLVPPGDPQALASAWRSVLADATLGAQLAAASRARAPEFDASVAVETLEQTYLRLASRDPSTAEVVVPQPPASTSPRPPALAIRPATEDDRPAILALLQRSLGSPDPRYPELFAWKHDRNVFGPSPMWVAVDRERVVAFRTFLRWEFLRGGQVVRAVRAVDTATDADYQGRGLFRALTMHAVEQMRDEGVAFVFNTPNDQSRPGYLRMGWRDVGRVPAAFRPVGPLSALRLARSRVPAERWSLPLDVGESVDQWLRRGTRPTVVRGPRHVRELTTNVSDPYLRWRYGLSSLHYRVVDDGDAAIVVRARKRGQATELSLVQAFGDLAYADLLAARTARDANADYALRVGTASAATGFAPLPGGGPRLTWRALAVTGMPPLPNWALSLGDVELF